MKISSTHSLAYLHVKLIMFSVPFSMYNMYKDYDSGRHVGRFLGYTLMWPLSIFAGVMRFTTPTKREFAHPYHAEIARKSYELFALETSHPNEEAKINSLKQDIMDKQRIYQQYQPSRIEHMMDEINGIKEYIRELFE